MSQPVDREATFRGRIVAHGLQEASDAGSQSLGLAIKVEVDECYNFETKEWEDWRSYQYECYGYVNLIKKDGTPNDKSAENLCKCTGWSGDINELASIDWVPDPIQFTTKAETFKNQTNYKVDFVNQYDRVPGQGIKSIDADKAKALSTRYGSKFRAIAANARRSEPPKDKPKSPPPAAVASGDVPFDKF